MKNSNFSLPIAIIGSVLIFGLTIGLSAKEAGFYVFGGITYWNDLEMPELSDEDTADLAEGTIEYEIDGSRAQPSIGVGYNFDEQWGFEAFYVATPERVLSIDDIVFQPVLNDDPVTLSVSTTIQHTVFGVSAVYDVYVNKNLSLFGKAGIAFTQHNSDASVSFTGLTLPFFDLMDLSFSEEEDTDDIFGAIGARIPLRAGDASMTFAYQFIETSDGRETSFELGVQWNF